MVIFRVVAGIFVTVCTSHWPEDFKTILPQTVISRQQFLDSITVLDFDRHTPAFKAFALGIDFFTLNQELGNEFLEHWGVSADSCPTCIHDVLCAP